MLHGHTLVRLTAELQWAHKKDGRLGTNGNDVDLQEGWKHFRFVDLFRLIATKTCLEVTEKSTDIEVDLVPRVVNAEAARVHVLRDVNIEIHVQPLPCHDQNQRWKRKRFAIVKRTKERYSKCLSLSSIFHL